MQIIQDQIPQELSGRMTKQSLERLANHLHLATQNEMGDIPLWLLWDLAEQRAEKAEQLYQQIKNFRISMMKNTKQVK